MREPVLPAGTAVDAASLPLEPSDLPADQVVSGSPGTATHELGTLAGAEVGVWEISEGVSTDVEVDELFVVIAGRATVDVEAGAGWPASSMELAPGTIGRLAAGMRTTWTVHERLRKAYLLG